MGFSVTNVVLVLYTVGIQDDDLVEFDSSLCKQCVNETDLSFHLLP